MRRRFVRITAAVLLMVLVIGSLMMSAAALDNSYRFDQFEMSVKFPKDDYVITPDTPSDDPVFEAVGLDYDSTMEAFHAMNIYLFAYDEEKTYQISMTVDQDDQSKAVNNYSDITANERKAIVEEVKNGENVTAAAEVKHSGNIFIESSRTASDGDRTVYIKLSNTIINGLRIDLTMQKYDEPLTSEEEKALSNAANSLKFDKINRKTGAVFEWWRLLLWVAILGGISVAVTFIYKRYNAENKRKLEERRRRHRATLDSGEHQPSHAESEDVTFEESLGYQNDAEFVARADADDEMASYDINVREHDPAKGIAFFEDEGSGIDDGSDYFDTYFKEPVEKRPWYRRMFSAAGLYLKSAAKHTGYFFKNLFAGIGRLFKKLVGSIKKAGGKKRKES